MADRSATRRPQNAPGSSGLNYDIFINCPFDEDYLACFEALLFVVTISGYRVRCALEEDDSGDIRLAKLCRMIEACDRTLHDLSRTQSGESGLPRFNMPFELGLAMGARQFGAGRQRGKRAFIMVSRPFVLPRYMSDLAGSDPAVHGDDPHRLIRVVRDHLHHSPAGRRLPGAAHMIELFARFRQDLPFLAMQARLTEAEAHARLGYRNYMDLLRAFCATMSEVGGRRGRSPPAPT